MNDFVKSTTTSLQRASVSVNEIWKPTRSIGHSVMPSQTVSEDGVQTLKGSQLMKLWK